ncbi:MAG TPA: hypothetical protein VOB72_13740, partial [Candidatus Dormibacteraeota bacterium]|nr:hypothetical protein [Candidatus Dormibacteraeota bacterium]
GHRQQRPVPLPVADRGVQQLVRRAESQHPPGRPDRALLAVPEPWTALPDLAGCLRPGGALGAASVNAPSVQRFCEELRAAGGWGLIQTFEVLERGWTVRDRSLRPAHRMVGHTAFLTFARRLAGRWVFEAESEGF